MGAAGPWTEGGFELSDSMVVSEQPQQWGRPSRLMVAGTASWERSYLRTACLLDYFCALAAGLLALGARFGGSPYGVLTYVWLSLTLPLLWLLSLGLAGAYDSRFIGVGSDEFRKVVNAGICATAVVAVLAYATRTDIARGYVLVALPCVTAFDLLVRFRLRKRLHRRRAQGICMHRVVVVGHADVVGELAATLRRETHHGLSVVAACALGPDVPVELDGIPVIAGLGNVVDAVRMFGADTVAVTSSPEVNGARLRDLAWELEKTGTDLCVAPALLDVAGPRTTIRPTAGLPLLHVDHPEFTGVRWLIKEVFDRTVAFMLLLLLVPVLGAIAAIIKLDDGGPALFRQTRVGKDGKLFTVFKFRTMVVDAERLQAQLVIHNEASGVLFKMRMDPRITRVGRFLRRYSLDELPQFINVLIGDMSLVGPRPALPQEAAEYGHHMRRRLRVKPGITGLWQVNGRSDLPWEEAVRLDVRYVENWSFVLDLQILWKTFSAVVGAAGAY